ncbi:hypothetical protein Desaci_2001 [Desulfosporosinus acidiphilus SJ4]|uniref:DUF3795 domain-containing protein n=1 Tax=Desulfosporosinus acidiphilus (strain DSM 22704 / JCM 16185 / SJ4) TaxID=646529 RepID=I4D5A2_DESAJ|nr:DUF3795 domain-containing protein [Desulfosporosinus acidiphilus]AFM40976.1 hypothetical protein Desaci_2001 [Desulfosporosinus acidiphilus SJ4]
MEEIAFCGNNCTACPRYTATVSGDILRIKAVAELWYRLGYRDTIVSVDEIMCYGCPTSSFCRYEIQQCASEKKVNNCGSCKEYPCYLMIKCFEQTQKYAESLKWKCTEKEYRCLEIAFFSKKENLDSANK